jgi:hypothetical protein
VSVVGLGSRGRWTMKPRIMYMECKSGGLSGPARIGRVSFSQTWRTVYYRGRAFAAMGRGGFKANYLDVETGQEYWISGCKRRGGDRLYPGMIEVDEDVREEYWTVIRGEAEWRGRGAIRCVGKYGR